MIHQTLIVHLRSEASGNCLYSSVSLVMVGDNSLVKTLRILKSTELFLNDGYYCNPRCFFSLINEHGKHFQKSINNLLYVPLFVSVECLDTGLAKNDLVGNEAILSITDKKCSSFLCILGLSVLHGNICILKILITIILYYPDSVKLGTIIVVQSIC